MNINRINQLENVVPVKAADKVKHSAKTADVAPIQVTKEAFNLAELQRVRDMALAAPGGRADRIAEVKAKMLDPNYLDKAIEATADRLISIYKL